MSYKYNTQLLLESGEGGGLSIVSNTPSGVCLVSYFRNLPLSSEDQSDQFLDTHRFLLDGVVLRLDGFFSCTSLFWCVCCHLLSSCWLLCPYLLMSTPKAFFFPLNPTICFSAWPVLAYNICYNNMQ